MTFLTDISFSVRIVVRITREHESHRHSQKRPTIDFMIKCDMKNFSSTITVAQQDRLISRTMGEQIARETVLMSKCSFRSYFIEPVLETCVTIPPGLIFTAADQEDLCIATRGANHCHRSLLCSRDWMGTLAKSNAHFSS